MNSVLDPTREAFFGLGSVRSSCWQYRLDGGNRVMTDRWLSVEEIAAYLGVSKDTVYAWIGKRNMPAHRIGRLWKFKSEEVDAWVRSGGAAEDSGREGVVD